MARMAIRYYTLVMKSLSQAAAFDTAIANAALRITNNYTSKATYGIIPSYEVQETIRCSKVAP